MANLPLAFAELLAGGVLVVAGSTGDTIGQVMRGEIVQNPLPGSSDATSQSSSSSGAGTAAVGAGQYVNPMPNVASWQRVDQGIDATITGNYRAIGRSKILAADPSSAGWKGGGYVAAQLLDGPYAGSVYYVAEGIKPLVTVGQEVAAGDPIATPVRSPYNNGIVGNLETGWANPQSPRQPLAQVTGGYSEGEVTAAGASFDAFLKGLGATGSTIIGRIVGTLAGRGKGSL